MARYQHLPIWRDANRLLLVVEQAVRDFPRDQMYTLGSDLRNQAMAICRLIIRANTAWEQRAKYIGNLVLAIEDIK